MSASVAASSTAFSAALSTTVAGIPVASHPCKQLVRAYLARRCKDTCPPPPLDEIRRELGWELLVAPIGSAPATQA